MLEIKLAYELKKEIEALLREYTQQLVERDPKITQYLALQNYEEELEHPEEKYGLPEGRLYIAFIDGSPAGCIALRKLDEARCEMKRLYVKPMYRGCGLACKMIDLLIADAQNAGYHAMYLDTLPALTEAVLLYKKYGFIEAEPYNNSPLDTTIFMKYELKG